MLIMKEFGDIGLKSKDILEIGKDLIVIQGDLGKLLIDIGLKFKDINLALQSQEDKQKLKKEK